MLGLPDSSVIGGQVEPDGTPQRNYLFHRGGKDVVPQVLVHRKIRVEDPDPVRRHENQPLSRK